MKLVWRVVSVCCVLVLTITMWMVYFDTLHVIRQQDVHVCCVQ